MTGRLVIDPSVAVKWFLRDALESNVDLAENVLTALFERKIELHAPPLFYFEVCNALTKACGHRYAGTRISRLTKTDAADHMRDLFELPIAIETMTEEEIIAGIDLAVDYSKLFYDMTYLALANKLGCQWCTADDKILKSPPTRFPSSRILLLSALRSSP